MTRHCLAALLLACSAAATAADPPAGPDTLLRAPDGIEGIAAAAGDAQGNFVLLTGRFLFPESRTLLSVERYAANGTALGAPQRVSDLVLPQEDFGAAAMNASGEFVLAWRSTQTFMDFQIMARRYAANGVAVGPAFQVGNVADVEGTPAVAMTPDGRFVVAWQSLYRIALTPGNQGAVLLLNYLWARPYRTDGTPEGAARLVHFKSGLNTGIDSPGVAMDAQGNFTVAWYDRGNGSARLMARRHLASGAPRGLAYTVTEGIGAVMPGRTPIVMQADGRHVIAWGAHNGQPYADVYARRLPAQGAPGPAAFRVNSHLPNAQDNPVLAMRAEGDWAAVWTSADQDGETGALNIYGQRYAASDAAQGGEFRVNAHTAGVQYNPQALLDAQGRLSVIWSGAGSAGDGFYLHRFSP